MALLLIALTICSLNPIESFHHAPFMPLRRFNSQQQQQKHTTFLHSAPPKEEIVAKTGGVGERTAAEDAASKNLSRGAPKKARPTGGHYLTSGGLQITTNVIDVEYGSQVMEDKLSNLIDRLDEDRGVLLSSSYEFPGRYARWTLGFNNPPVEIVGKTDTCTFTALNDRGKVLLPAIQRCMEQYEERQPGVIKSLVIDNEDDLLGVSSIEVKINMDKDKVFEEEDRSKQPSLFSILREILQLFSHSSDDGQLGLYGAFGYDLTFQFEPITLYQDRNYDEQRDLVLYLPDEIFVMDLDKHQSYILQYDFLVNGSLTTVGLPRVPGTGNAPFKYFEGDVDTFLSRDTPQNEFSNSVLQAKHEFKVGNLFETVLSQTFRKILPESKSSTPSSIFRRLCKRNPSPYGFLMNLGEQEYLVGASPEMFVRCEYTNDDRLRVETCPISGTVARGEDALEDAKRIKSLIMNKKEESELTMCTDVDRNDKSRICLPGTVKVIGRRQIEMYSRLIHTVDHVEGYLRDGFDALDAFLCHTWAVTVTGAPKTWAIQFVEKMERSPRHWYGGAVGHVGFDGCLNTGLTLRTVRIKNGVAEVRAGATLLYDSDPDAEEAETELKASAMIDAVIRPDEDEEEGTVNGLVNYNDVNGAQKEQVGTGLSIVLIDHEDSFVHTLGNYLRQTGAGVKTLRSGQPALDAIQAMVNDGNKPSMVVLSPGPGNPTDFKLSRSLDLLTKLEIPVFGVCLGLQGIVEHFEGTLGILDYPMHGKPSLVSLTSNGKAEGSIFTSLPETFEVARYHSLHGIEDKLPACLDVTAVSEDGIVMGIQHKSLPIAAVQFHPESILTNPMHGLTILKNALLNLKYNLE